MNLLVLKQFNNYFNRKIIKYSELESYENASHAHIRLSNINFNPNDGIVTELVLGQGDLEGFFDFEKTNAADYLVCYTTEESVDTIESRWFITEVQRTRAGQYKISLKRDSISDNFEYLLNCPAFIRKGTVADDNPLVVNSEGVTVNQIKKGETLLKDASNSSWIVGYMAKNAPASSITEQIPDESQFSYETIESIAASVGIQASDLDNLLTAGVPGHFVNDNIELVGWVNFVDNSSNEYRLIAGSYDGLANFQYSKFNVMRRGSPADCFSKDIKNPNYPSDRSYPIDVSTTARNKLADLWRAACENYKESIKAAWPNILGLPLLPRAVLNKLNYLKDNNILIYKLGKYYKINVGTSEGPTNTGEIYYSSATAAPISLVCSKVISDFNNWSDAQGHWFADNVWNAYPHLESRYAGKVFFNYNDMVVDFYLQEVTNLDEIPGISVTMSSTRNVIYDQPYDMFAIPASNTILKNGADEYEVVGDYAQKSAMALVKNLTDANVYDVQLLPYCPVPEIAQNGKVDITNLTSGYDYDIIYQTDNTTRDQQTGYTQANEYELGRWEALLTIDTGLAETEDVLDKGYEILEGDDLVSSPGITMFKSNGTVKIRFYAQIQYEQDADYIRVSIWYKYNKVNRTIKSVIIYPKSNSFSVTLDYNLSLTDSMKIDANCDLYRLVSPNYQGSFDFNVAKNGGTVRGFVADCTYKPFTPYIKVAPNFNWLYGTNYGDARGLICGGDFSIGLLSDKWQEYQLQNKNYQNIFNREIQNLDVNQSIARTQQYTAGAINIATSGLKGVASGALIGGGLGAAIGGVAGAGGSALGYAVDNQLMERQLIEQRQFAIDKFNLQIGNIQALPYTLTKVGAFNINSKIWPFLEYYTCTPEEKQALRQKILYEGMTIGIVDTLGDYMVGGYLKADLIRNDAIIDDSHLLEDIYIELTKGVYL